MKVCDSCGNRSRDRLPGAKEKRADCSEDKEYGYSGNFRIIQGQHGRNKRINTLHLRID